MPQSLVAGQSESPPPLAVSVAWLANGGRNDWLSYSGIVRVLFPEQLRAVAEGLCRRNVVHSISVLKVSMCAARVCPGVHRRSGRFFLLFLLKRNKAALLGSSSEKQNITSVKGAFWRRTHQNI